jgi:hypothetical protein
MGEEIVCDWHFIVAKRCVNIVSSTFAQRRAIPVNKQLPIRSSEWPLEGSRVPSECDGL